MEVTHHRELSCTVMHLVIGAACLGLSVPLASSHLISSSHYLDMTLRDISAGSAGHQLDRSPPRTPQPVVLVLLLSDNLVRVEVIAFWPPASWRESGCATPLFPPGRRDFTQGVHKCALLQHRTTGDRV